MRNFSFIFTGTLVVQVIKFLLSPVFSRLYTPADFGTFGTLAAVMSIAAIGFNLKYEVAIVLPEKKREALSLVMTALTAVSLFTGLSFFFVLLFRDNISSLIFKDASYQLYFFYVPLGVMVASLTPVCRHWLVFLKEFKLIAVLSIISVIANSSVKLVCGLLDVGVPGLLASHFTGFFFVVLVTGVHFFKKHADTLKKITIDSIRKNARKYKNFPLYTAPQSLINSFSQQLPMLFLTPAYGEEVTGNYFFAFALVGMPLVLISQSFRKVFYKKLSDINNAGRDLFAPVLKSTLILAGIAVVPFTLLFIFSPAAFPFILGEQWQEAGYYARYLSIWLFFGFFNVPAMVTIHVKMKQNLLFFYEMFLTLSRFSMLYFGAATFVARDTILGYSIIGAFFNTCLVICVLFLIKKRKAA